MKLRLSTKQLNVGIYQALNYKLDHGRLFDPLLAYLGLSKVFHLPLFTYHIMMMSVWQKFSI
jgi:hypothetical protein